MSTGNPDERVRSSDWLALLDAAQWLAIEVSGHPEGCTCGSCFAVARTAHFMTAKRSRQLADIKASALRANETMSGRGEETK